MKDASYWKMYVSAAHCIDQRASHATIVNLIELTWFISDPVEGFGAALPVSADFIVCTMCLCLGESCRITRQFENKT